MKDKLILRLNELMKKPMNDLDELLRLLVVLSQRSSQDADLLKNAKENSTFTISDLEQLRKKISERKEFLGKMDSLVEKQVEKLRELNFNDSFETPISEEFVSKVIDAAVNAGVTIETADQALADSFPANWRKPSAIMLEGKELNIFFGSMKNFPSSKATIYFSGVKISFMAGKAHCYGVHTGISRLRPAVAPQPSGPQQLLKG
jgi:hypothetical protein